MFAAAGMLCPPFTATTDEIDHAMEVLDDLQAISDAEHRE